MPFLNGITKHVDNEINNTDNGQLFYMQSLFIIIIIAFTCFLIFALDLQKPVSMKMKEFLLQEDGKGSFWK